VLPPGSLNELFDHADDIRFAAYRSGPLTMRQIADHLGVHYCTISRLLIRMEIPNAGPDPLGLDVQICSRPADLPFPMNQFDHWWIKTSTVEAGMGPMNGQVPAQQGRSDSPGDPVQTVNHSGQSSAANAQCRVMNNVDEDCVNKLIRPGQALGRWTPVNQCNNFAWSVISKCRKGPQIPPKRVPPPPSPVEKTVQSVSPQVPK